MICIDRGSRAVVLEGVVIVVVADGGRGEFVARGITDYHWAIAAYNICIMVSITCLKRKHAVERSRLYDTKGKMGVHSATERARGEFCRLFAVLSSAPRAVSRRGFPS